MGEENYLDQYENDLAAMQAQQQQQGMSAYAPTQFSNVGNKQNLVEWELDFKPELESIERLLRCDIIQRDKEGTEYWVPNPDLTKRFFNDQGVNDFLRSLIVIVNKNKVLSNYTSEEINERVKQIKHEIRILIYNNYEEYGMDNEYKWNNYSMIVIAIGSIVEDAYRRAMQGSTHRGLAEQRLVTQSESFNQMPQQYMPQGGGGSGGNSNKRKFWNPFTW